MTGTVYLVGAGPGAPDLLTLRAAKLLALADIVFYDALIDHEMLFWCKRSKLVPVGKRCGAHSSSQHFINKAIVDAADSVSTDWVELFQKYFEMKRSIASKMARQEQFHTALRTM